MAGIVSVILFITSTAISSSLVTKGVANIMFCSSSLAGSHSAPTEPMSETPWAMGSSVLLKLYSTPPKASLHWMR